MGETTLRTHRAEPYVAVPNRLPAPAAHRSLMRTPSLRSYIAGNGLAVLTGFLIAFAGLAYLNSTHVIGVLIKDTDFLPYYAAGYLVLGGHAGKVYDPAAIFRVESHIALPYRMRAVNPYPYPPFHALAMTPLASLPYAAAYAVWAGISILLLFVALYQLESYSLLSRRQALLARLLAVASLPVLNALLVGQVTILFLAAATLALCALLREHDGLAGTLLSVWLIKPTYAVPLLVILFVHRRFKALLTFAGTGATLALAPLFVFGPHAVSGYLRALRMATSFTSLGYDAMANQTVFGFVQRLGVPPNAIMISVIIAIVGLSVLAAVSRHAPFDVAFGLAILTGLLVSPHVLLYDLSLWLLPVTILIRNRQRSSTWSCWGLLAGYCLLPVAYRLAFSAPIQLSVVLALILAWQLWLAGSRERPPSSRALDGHGMSLPAARPTDMAERGS